MAWRSKITKPPRKVTSVTHLELYWLLVTVVFHSNMLLDLKTVSEEQKKKGGLKPRTAA